MSKRKLSKQQIRRISDQQQDRKKKSGKKNSALIDESSLGPEKPGIIISYFGSQADVECHETGSLYRCHLRANLGAIVVGDCVVWREGPNSEGVIVAIQERDSQLMRPDSYGKLKLVAANVTRVLIVIAPYPEPFSNLIDRYLISAENNDLDIFIIINKADLMTGDDACTKIINKYTSLDYRVLCCSSKTHENMATLAEIISTGCSIFVGQSGVGKSSIISTFLPNENIQIGQLSAVEKKGRHTTTYARLYHFKDGGHCIDSPGIREFGLWHMTPAQISYGFKEFRELIGSCRFRDCKHTNEPGCALHTAIEAGEILQERFDSFQMIINSLDQVNMINAPER